MSIMMEYLRQLQKNNQRDWFQSHKELRKEAEAEFEELLQELMERIACFYSDRKSTRLNSSHRSLSRMPSSA